MAKSCMEQQDVHRAAYLRATATPPPSTDGEAQARGTGQTPVKDEKSSALPSEQPVQTSQGGSTQLPSPVTPTLSSAHTNPSLAVSHASASSGSQHCRTIPDSAGVRDADCSQHQTSPQSRDPRLQRIKIPLSPLKRGSLAEGSNGRASKKSCYGRL